MNEVILYTQPGCGKCIVLKRLLERNGIKFESSSDIEFIKSKGFTSTPVLGVNGDLMDFNSATDWIKSMEVNH